MVLQEVGHDQPLLDKPLSKLGGDGFSVAAGLDETFLGDQPIDDRAEYGGSRGLFQAVGEPLGLGEAVFEDERLAAIAAMEKRL